jgi:hypothetical protein
MASHRIETYCQRLAFPIGALIFSRGINRLVRCGSPGPDSVLQAPHPWRLGATSTSSQWLGQQRPHFNRARRWNRTM